MTQTPSSADRADRPNEYHIRFNTKHHIAPQTDLVWRIFENGIEHKVRSFEAEGVKFTNACTEENGEIKYNLYCEGYMKIQDDHAIISNMLK